MNWRWLLFRAEPDGGAPFAGGGGADPGVAPEPAPAPDPVAPAPSIFDEPQQPTPEPAAPTWTPQHEEGFREMQGFMGEMRDLFEQARAEELAEQQRQAAEPGQLPPYDPTDPQNVAAYAAAAIMPQLAPQFQAISDQLAQLAPLVEHAASERGTQVANDVFDQLAPQLGEFDRELALDLAVAMRREGFDGEEAIKGGAMRARELEEKIRADERTKVTGGQAAVGALRGEPAAAAAGGEPLPDERFTETRQQRLERRQATLARLAPAPPQ